MKPLDYASQPDPRPRFRWEQFWSGFLVGILFTMLAWPFANALLPYVAPGRSILGMTVALETVKLGLGAGLARYNRSIEFFWGVLTSLPVTVLLGFLVVMVLISTRHN